MQGDIPIGKTTGPVKILAATYVKNYSNYIR